MTIAKIDEVTDRFYNDNQQRNLIVDWTDDKGRRGCTTGLASSAHMLALWDRALREGAPIKKEVW